MTRTTMFWVALLVATLTTACGGAGTSSGAGTPDAANTNSETAVVPDAPVSQPDVVLNDAGPTTDAAVDVAVDVTTDVADALDVAADTVTDRTAVPDTTMIVTGFDRAICEMLNSHRFQVHGSTMEPDSIICTMQADGLSARITISTDFSNAMGCGYTRASCSRPGTCGFPNEASMTCTWTEMSVSMTSFRARSPDGEYTIDVTR